MVIALLGKRTALHVSSDTGPRDGPVVVLVHGIASSSATFAGVMAALPRHRIVALDLLGFGRSAAPAAARFTIEEHAAALGAAVDKLRLAGFVLVGHSLGALVVSRYAAEHPRGLTAVVLVSPPIYVPEKAMPSGRARVAMRLYLRSFDYLRQNKRFTMRLARWVSRLLPVPRILDVNEGNWAAFELSLENAIETQTSVVDIASTTVPVVIVVGTLDPFVVPEMMTLLGTLRHERVRRVARGTHIVGRALSHAVAESVRSYAPAGQARNHRGRE